MDESRTLSTQDDRLPLALAAGLVAALLGGVGWAAIVLFTSYEIGWAAWAIGGLVGFAMTRATPARSKKLAVAAATLALVGLLAGKAFVALGSAGVIADELTATPEYLAGGVAWQMYDAGELAPATMQALEFAEDAGDTLSDALWEDMLAQASARIASMSDEERQAVADEIASNYVAQMGLVEGVVTQLSGFDLLWIVLALGTAFQMMNAQELKPEPASLATAEDEESEKEPVA
jgi:hypothetical protein